MNQNFTPSPDLPPPCCTVGFRAWSKIHLFSNIGNTCLTIFFIGLAILAIPDVILWLFINADWLGETRKACEFIDGTPHDGACWVFIEARFHQFIFGRYPESEYWRVILALVLFTGLIVYLAIQNLPHKKWVAIFAFTIFPIIAFYLMSGGIFGLTEVETALWGGLSLTLILSAVGMTTALPFGILLALGRRSKMPIIRSLSVIFIEFIRGLPLITVLFMAYVMLPLFLPEGVSFDILMRALIGIALFQSAYMAEVVRSGLQAIPKGQYEATDAMGLSFFNSHRLIILPQALKLVIPGIVNTFIELFKDTSLVSIIGMFELLGIAEMVIQDANWLGFSTESYIFAAFIFWIFCFGMSQYSQLIERRLNTGH